MVNQKLEIKIAFFGTDEFSVFVLEELKNAGIIPDLIVTTPDRPKGRKLVLTPCEVKVWADENKIETLQPEKLDDNFISKIKKYECELFLVASYGLIIPNSVLKLPKYKALNVHPSLLPKYRGATPIETAILNNDKETGVTVMRMDEKMDHGPILDQEVLYFENWPDKMEVLEKLARDGGRILAQIIPEWILGNIDEQEQEHNLATFTEKIEKSDGELNLEDDPYLNFLKYKAYKPWPGTFFFKDGKRMKITEAEFIPSRHPEPEPKNEARDSGSRGKFIIKKVIPEGKKEILYPSS